MGKNTYLHTKSVHMGTENIDLYSFNSCEEYFTYPVAAKLSFFR